MKQGNERQGESAAFYDEEAEATGWLGPEIIFGLLYKYIQPGQTVLDIGIGTGLGSALFLKAGLRVHGMDVSQEMLDACRKKGFTDLSRHDLLLIPYPFDSRSFDHAVCTGVFHFFDDLSPVFVETARILKNGGLFGFVAGDCPDDEEKEFVVPAEYTHSDRSMIIYRHGERRIDGWLGEHGFEKMSALAFMTYMDREKRKNLPARAYLARKAPR